MISPANESGPVAVTFAQDTRILSLSSGIAALTGYSGNEIIGASVARLLDDGTVFHLPHILDTVKDKGIWEGEITCLDCDAKPVKGYGTILLLAGGSDRHAAYLLLLLPGEVSKTESRPNFHYSDVGRRMRTLVHDLNNSLAVIMGTTQLLAITADDSGKVQSDIGRIYAELEKVALAVEKLHEHAFSLCEQPVVADARP
jgi:nitrogen-specific signal transduction histidine kinase